MVSKNYEKLATLVSLTALGLGCGANYDVSETKPEVSEVEQEVINGIKGDIQDSLYSVVFTDETGKIELCSGTLIAPDFVFTAAHCISTSLKKVVSGVPDINKDYDGSSMHNVAIARSHPHHYSLELYVQNDVGWALLEKPIPNAVTVDILPKNKFSSELEIGEMVRYRGFGKNNDPNSEFPFGIFYYGDGPIHSFFTDRGPNDDPSCPIEEMLVGDVDNPKAPHLCFGDSGGGTFITVDGKEYLAANTSRSPPDVYPPQCGRGAVTALAGHFDDLTEDMYEIMVRCRDEGIGCGDIPSEYEKEESRGAGGYGAAGNNGYGSCDTLINGNHEERSAYLSGKNKGNCSYSGGNEENKLGLLLLGLVGLGFGLRRKEKGVNSYE